MFSDGLEYYGEFWINYLFDCFILGFIFRFVSIRVQNKFCITQYYDLSFKIIHTKRPKKKKNEKLIEYIINIYFMKYDLYLEIPTTGRCLQKYDKKIYIYIHCYIDS